MITTKRFIKGIHLLTWTIKAHFNVLLPQYMEFIDTNPSTYFGWKITPLRLYPNSKLHLCCEKELPYNEALPESIWFRKQLQKTFRLYNHYYKPRRNSKLGVTLPSWIHDMESQFEERESKYVYNYQFNKETEL